MLFRVNHSSGVSLAEQVAEQVRSGVRDGTIEPGERLPPARDLAASLDVNMHTVLRAYQALREEGLIELRRGRGAIVRADAATGAAGLNDLAGQLLAEAHKLGLSHEDVLRLIERNHQPR